MEMWWQIASPGKMNFVTVSGWTKTSSAQRKAFSDFLPLINIDQKVFIDTKNVLLTAR